MAVLERINAGFLPLTDAAVLIAAREFGFAEEEGIDLNLLREISWANIRDRLAVGHFDAAHMLAPMPIASNLGLSPLPLPLIAPMALGLGGNAVTVSRVLHAAMLEHGAADDADAGKAGLALKTVIEDRKASGEPVLSFAVVHPYSGHNFELRYWLAGSEIDPEEDVTIVVVPPPLMVDALASGRIDGYCVGEPWNSLAVLDGHGAIATVKSAIWKDSPEKVLGVREDWSRQNPELLAALVRALYRSARWCGEAANAAMLARCLARPYYVDKPEAVILPALTGRIPLTLDKWLDMPDFFLPFTHEATFPWQSHALWFFGQMVRWGQVEFSAENMSRARTSYRPDIYRDIIAPLDPDLPETNSKVESGFFDGRIFDSDNPDFI